MMIRSSLPSASIAAAAKRVIAEKRPDVVTQFADFQREIRDCLVYGVISYIVAMRRNEIGIRMALGASRSDVVSIIVRQTLVLLALGIGVGVVLALAAVRSASSFFSGCNRTTLSPSLPPRPSWPPSLSSPVFYRLAALPAVDPMVALRYE